MTFLDFKMGHQKVPKSDFQCQFSMLKIILIFLIFFFKHLFRRTFYCHILFLKHFLNFENFDAPFEFSESQIKKNLKTDI